MARLTLLQLNDLHGYLEPHPELVRTGGGWRFEQLGGLARIASIFAEARAEAKGAALTLDNGDTFHGSYVALQSKGEALVPLMNALKIDAMTAHWEFAYGPAGFATLAAQLDYPVLAANVFRKADGAPAFEGRRVFERGGLNVGVIGLACPIVDKTMPPSFSEGLRFEIGVEECRHHVTALRDEGVDLVVVLSHLGFPQDVQLAGDVDGIDVIVSGHTHNRMHEPALVNGAIIFQSGCHGAFVGRLDLEVEAGRVVSHHHVLIPVNDHWPEDPEMTGLIDAAMAPHRALLSEVVGRTTVPLHRYAMPSAPMDDVLLDAIAAAADVEIAFSNGWRYGAPVAPGPVTLNDLYNIIPMNPPVSRVDLTGAAIRQMLEDNLERTFAADAYEQMGGYIKRCRGLTAFVKIENPKGERVDRLFVGDEPVDPERVYPCAFVTTQGVPKRFGTARRDLPVDAITALRRWLSTNLVGDRPRPESIVVV
ncbi:MAG: bifunctional metallophosphatase/5'-nucleotidase [Alphaproteobacteria bacterium]|nr:bifunctional metallophosphatase/5'-nucleotidase [Alphaproteobacteria bacterium]MBU2378384.1 bifunctional metallophosphatase/5'-nucleotidase [Alphaproteobacteria bacterium]